jgi:hypothetical protein
MAGERERRTSQSREEEDALSMNTTVYGEYKRQRKQA